MRGRLLTAFALPVALATGFQLLHAGADTYQWDLPNGFPKPRVPVSNPMSPAKARLGRYLFYDRRLSVNGTQACATCHRQKLAFTDGRAAALGATGQNHPRSSMSLVNVAYSAVLTWSNPNLRSLEKQALIPMLGEHPVELGLRGRENTVLSELRSDSVYREIFPKAFPDAKDPFTFDNVARAVAAFERTIISARSPYDSYYRGGEPNAISDAAKRGEALFFSDGVAGCFRCHGASTSATRPNTKVALILQCNFITPGSITCRICFPIPSPMWAFSNTRNCAPTWANSRPPAFGM